MSQTFCTSNHQPSLGNKLPASGFKLIGANSRPEACNLKLAANRSSFLNVNSNFKCSTSK